MRIFNSLVVGICAGLASLVLSVASNSALAIPIVNSSFETDVNDSGQFFFGDPFGWSLIDSGGIIVSNSNLDVQGTINLPGQPFYNGLAPDGNKVALLFISDDIDTTEIGLSQTLTTNLAANTQYTLSVEVGNIGSGNGPFDLGGFPGYRIELLAGGNVLVDDVELINSPIGEDEFQTRNLVFTTDATSLFLGLALEIRLFNLNLADPDNPGAALEVNFDDVRLDAIELTAVPVPAALPLMAGGLGLMGFIGWRKRRRTFP